MLMNGMPEIWLCIFSNRLIDCSTEVGLRPEAVVAHYKKLTFRNVEVRGGHLLDLWVRCFGQNDGLGCR